MILLNGCSFSTSTGLDDRFEHLNWPKQLSEKLNVDIKNLSVQGKSNELIIRELYTYLIWAKQGKLEMPEKVIVQFTDFFRDYAYNFRMSGAFKPNNFESQLYKHFNNFVKLRGHKIRRDLDNENSSIRIPDTVVADFDVKTRQYTPRMYIGDYTLREQQLRNLWNLNCLKNLCDILNIPLIFFNFMSFGGRIRLDPLYTELHKSIFVLDNQESDFYDYMLAMGFETTDEMHLNIDGHKFICDIVYDFIVYNKKFNFESIQPLDQPNAVFDYI